MDIQTEQQLTDLAAQILCRSGKDGPASAADLDDIRAAIRQGDDPLGDDLACLRPAEARRAQGAFYTPRPIVEAMIDWAAAEVGDAPARVVDAGSGSGRFFLAAARAFPQAQLVAVEIDRLAAKLLWVNAHIAGFADRLTVHVGDYRTFCLPPIKGKTLFVSNPPYVRHHLISEEAKRWFATTAKRFGFRASKLAGLHIHFFLRTREIAKADDFGTFITSSEWMDVNYGSVLRHMLADGLGGTALHVINPAANPFNGAMTTGAITCFRVGNRPKNFAVRTVMTLADLKPLSDGQQIEWRRVANASRWSELVRAAPVRPSGVVELGELFRVHRGQVTGCNRVWVMRPNTPELPARFLVPAITHARELFASGGDLRSADHLRCVIELPVDLDSLTESERAKVARFLRWARSYGAHKSYVARHRRAWWAVGLREPAPIVCTYMARRPPAFVRNTAEAHLLNIAHGLYPRETMCEAQLAAYLCYLRRTVSTTEGRTYAGGLVKFEPREVERLYVPLPETLAESGTA